MEDQYNESQEVSNPIQNTPTENSLFSPATMYQFLGAAKWAKVISIIYLVLIGLTIIALLTSASTFLLMLGRGGGIFLVMGAVFYAGLLGVLFYMLYKLYNFSKYAKYFSVSKSEQDLNLAFTNLKQFFFNIVIVMVIGFVFYFIMVIVMVFFASNISDF